MLCDYGCGQEAKYINRSKKHCCEKDFKKCPNFAIHHGNIIRKAKQKYTKEYFGDELCYRGCGNQAKYMYGNGKVGCSKNVSGCPSVNAKKIKSYIEHYGCSNPMKNKEIMIDQNRKRDDTILEKYGVKNPIHIEGMKERLQDIFEKKFGVSSPAFLMKRSAYAQNDWLDFLGVPDDEDHREVIIDLKDNVKSGKVVVDGYDPEKKIIYEFLGDYWHGNLDRYSSDTINKANKKTMAQLNEEMIQRKNRILVAGYQIIDIWECDWKIMKENIKMKNLHRENNNIQSREIFTQGEML